MEQTVHLLCKYGKYTAVVATTSHFGYDELVSFVCERWVKLNREGVNFTYGLPGNSKTLLDCELDFRLMLKQVRSIGLSSIEVRVSKNKRVIGGESDDDDVDEGSSIGSSSIVVSGNEENPLSKYCKHEKKLLLTGDWKHLITGVGQGFEGGVEEFRAVLTKFSIGTGYNFKWLKNEKGRATARCKYFDVTKCMWSIHAVRNSANGWFYIKDYVPNHTCGSDYKKRKHDRISATLVAKCMESEIRKKPHTKPCDVVEKFKDDYGLEISYHHAWHGVEQAKGGLYGDHRMSFDLLRWYIDESLKTNPGSVFELDVVQKTGRFRRIFVSYEACMFGFNYCRPMLFLDGTFLKSRYKGVLLSASAKDGNQGVFPLCYAVVDSETDANWLWFLQHLKSIVDPDREITFLSDRNSGILKGVPAVFPNSFHAYCLHHLKLNLRDRCSGTPQKVKDSIAYKFVQCAYAPTEADFEVCMEVFKKECGQERAKDFLKNLPLENWANAFFCGKRYGEMTSNLAECFNNMIGPCRDLPIVEMLDWIRVKLMEHMTERRDTSSKWNSVVCHALDRKINDAIQEVMAWRVSKSIGGVFEVFSNPSVFVDIVERSCSCYAWQFESFPCSHAVAAILESKEVMSDYVDPYYHSDRYRATYSHAIYPVPTINRPSLKKTKAVILPPIVKRQAGRRKKKRISSRGEKEATRMCSSCKKYTHHTKKTCECPLND